MTTTTSEVGAPTPAEQLATAEAKHDQISGLLEIARVELADLRVALAKEKEAYLASIAGEIDGGERPSRARLTELEHQLPEAVDRVEALARALLEAARRAREAKADVLDSNAIAVDEETARRQARINELEPQRFAILREIYEHSAWIGNEGPKAHQLRAEAQRLRSQ